MKISDIDVNFKISDANGYDNIEWYDAKDAPFSIHGLYRKEKGKRFLRLPEEVTLAINEKITELGAHTAGGRVRFKTDSDVIILKVLQPNGGIMQHMTVIGQRGFDMYTNEGKDYHYAGSFFPGDIDHGYSSSHKTDGKLHTYTLNMPLYMPVHELYIGLRQGSQLLAPEPYTYEKPVLFYGSSVTQGGCASRPGNSYQGMISRRLDCDYINLGFSGNGRAEKPMVEYLSSLDVSVFVCDYDHNAYNAEYLQNTHKPLYEAFRSTHKNTPIIFVSKSDFNPDVEDDVKRREIILKTYNDAIAAGDKNVYFVDGAHIFDGDFRDSCTVDGTHPNDLGFLRMAQKIGDAVAKVIE